jgi:tRNA-2-methylthio-N6-dimethylallyladenosine synthase
MPIKNLNQSLLEKHKSEFSAPSYFIQTYGCQMNKNDSEHIAGFLEASGYFPAQDEAQASMVVLNTCSIRDKSERKAFGKFYELQHDRKKANPYTQAKKQSLAIAGCMPGHDLEGVEKKLPFLDFFIDVHEARKFPAKREVNDTAWVTIQNGCNHFCTYCIVPYSRGQETYRSVEEIVQEIEKIPKEKYRAISLLGQNINSYRGFWHAQDKVADFADILTIAHEHIGDCRLEFLTSHPKDMDDRAIAAMASLPKLHHEIHIPVQAGANRILKRMNRGYTREFYIELVNKIRTQMPHAKISTDIIVGFPGETEAEFVETCELIKQIGFFRVNTAAFSVRPGTPAARMTEQLDEVTKSLRLQRVMKVVDQYKVA